MRVSNVVVGLLALGLATAAWASETISVTTPSGAQTLTIGTIQGVSGTGASLDPGRYYRVDLVSEKEVTPVVDHHETYGYYFGATSFNYELNWDTSNESAGTYNIQARLQYSPNMNPNEWVDLTTGSQGSQTLQ